MALVSTCRTRARDCFSSGGAEALSKSVSRAGPGMLASCCQETAAPGAALKSDFFGGHLAGGRVAGRVTGCRGCVVGGCRVWPRIADVTGQPQPGDAGRRRPAAPEY